MSTVFVSDGIASIHVAMPLPLCEKFLVIRELEKNRPRAEVAKKFAIKVSKVASIWEERNKPQYKWLADALQSWHDDPKRDINTLRIQTKKLIKEMQLGWNNRAKACYQSKRKLDEEYLPVPSKKTKVTNTEEKAFSTKICDSDLSCTSCLPDGYLTSCKWDVRDNVRSDQRLAIIDDALLNWFNKIKRTQVCINPARLREKVKEFVEFLNYGNLNPVSNWFKAWRQRHRIPLVVSGPTMKFGLFYGKVEVSTKTKAGVSKKTKNVSSDTLKEISSKSISNDIDPIGPSSVNSNLKSTKCNRIPLQEKLDVQNIGAILEGEQVISDMDRALLAWYIDATSVGRVVSSKILLEKAHYFSEILCFEIFDPFPDFPSQWKKRVGLLENSSNVSESKYKSQNEVILSQSDVTVTEEDKNEVRDIARKFKIDESDVARIVKREKKTQKIVTALKIISLEDCNLVLKELYKKKKTFSEIALSFEIPETTVKGIWEHRLKLLAVDKLDNLDAYLLCWYNKCKREQSDVNDRILLKKAKYFAKCVKKTDLNLSNDWVKRWRKRCGLRACKKNLVKKVDSNTGHDFEPPSKRIKTVSSSFTGKKTKDITYDAPQLKENNVCRKSDQEIIGKNGPLRRDIAADSVEVSASHNSTENHKMEVPLQKDDFPANLRGHDSTLSTFDETKPEVIDHKDSNTHPCNEKVLDALCTISERLVAAGIDMRNFLKLEKQVLDDILENAGSTN